MNATSDHEPLRKPQISRFMFAMFDVRGFSRWVESVGLHAVLDSYHLLIERIVRPNEKGGWVLFRLGKVRSSQSPARQGTHTFPTQSFCGTILSRLWSTTS